MYNPKFDLYIISKKKIVVKHKTSFSTSKDCFLGEFNVFRPKLFVFHRIKREPFCGKSFARAHPVAGFYNVFDVVCGDFSFADVNERACDNPHHIVQKSVARNSYLDVFAVFYYFDFFNRPYGVLYAASRRLETPEIVRAFDKSRGFFHFRKIKGDAYIFRRGVFQRIEMRRQIKFINVRL